MEDGEEVRAAVIELIGRDSAVIDRDSVGEAGQDFTDKFIPSACVHNDSALAPLESPLRHAFISGHSITRGQAVLRIGKASARAPRHEIRQTVEGERRRVVS